MKRIFFFIKKNYLFVAILIFSIILRVYRLEYLTTFSGDQGQDFLVVRDMVLFHKWTLLGIKTSIAPFFQGPIYLYLLFPFFLLFHLDPIAGAIASVTLSILSITVLYITVKKFLSKESAFLSCLLFATAPQLVIYGNSPLYQNFLPLFIISSIYFFLVNKKNALHYLLLGLFAGVCLELHLLSITLALSFFIFLLIFDDRRKQSLPIFIGGLLLALSPTILFELRHQFLNTHLFLAYLQSNNTPSTLINIGNAWVKGAALFLGGDSMIVGSIILIFSFFALIRFKTSQRYVSLKKFTIILTVVLLVFSFKLSSLEPHYLLPLWIMLLILLPVWILKIFPRKIGVILMVILIIFNFLTSAKELQNNHGYNMPNGWTLRKIKDIGKIIAKDSKTHPNFNVASLLDGNTRTYPVRYTTLLYGRQPESVESYPSNKFLYVVSRSDKNNLYTRDTWEIASLRPFKIGKQWNLKDEVFLYRLERVEKK